MVLIRQRYQLYLKYGEAPVMAEEILVRAFSGMPSDPKWLNVVDSEALLDARSSANLQEQVIETQKQDLTLAVNMQDMLDPIIEARAAPAGFASAGQRSAESPAGGHRSDAAIGHPRTLQIIAGMGVTPYRRFRQKADCCPPFSSGFRKRQGSTGTGPHDYQLHRSERLTERIFQVGSGWGDCGRSFSDSGAVWGESHAVPYV